MNKIDDDIYLLEGLRISNVYLLVSGSNLSLVDAGTAGDAKRIAGEIEGAGYSLSQLRSIVVTHAHLDHTGGINPLVQRSGADVLAHHAEAPFIEGRADLPVKSPVLKVMRWVEKRLSRKNGGIPVTRKLQDGESPDAPGGLEVIHTPGHTPGSICLYQREKEVLFCGDLIFNGHPLTGRGGLRYAPRAFSVDPEDIPKSARRLSGLKVKALCVGHGEPIIKEGGLDMEGLLPRIKG